METNIEKLARLEKELAEVRENLEKEQSPDLIYGQFYKKDGNYYVVICAFNRYILANLTYGTHWKLEEGEKDEMKKELRDNGFEFVGTYDDYLRTLPNGSC